MTDGASPASGAVTCWNCHQPLPAGADRCIWCGVPQSAGAAAPVMAPTGYAGMAGAVGVAPDRAQGATTMLAPPVLAPTAGAPLQVAPPVDAALGPEFRGTVAATGQRIAAFAVDVVLITVVAIVVLAVTRSVAFGVLTALEAVIGSWVMQARTGATVGQRVLRLRASRVEGPFSPGAVASLTRFAITGVGFAALGIGAWLVVASGMWDPARRRRSFADRATRTIIVAAPPRPAPSAAPPIVPLTARAAAAGHPPVLAPTGLLQPPSPAVVAPPSVQVIAPPATPLSAQQGAPLNPTAPPSATQPPPPAPVTPPPGKLTPTPMVLAEPQVVSTRRPSTPIDDESASAQAPAVVPEEPIFETVAVQRPVTPTGSALLLIFDTGQREQIALPAAINLGRNPVASQDGDALISVRDPDSTVSKTHARVEHLDGQTWVSDGGSTNGTEVISDEGVIAVLVPRVRTLLEEGARIRIGKRAFTVSVLVGGAP